MATMFVAGGEPKGPKLQYPIHMFNDFSKINVAREIGLQSANQLMRRDLEGRRSILRT
jgi:hypothetical protein